MKKNFTIPSAFFTSNFKGKVVMLFLLLCTGNLFAQLNVDLGADHFMCPGESTMLGTTVSGEASCTVPCDLSGEELIAYWDMEDCASFVNNGSNATYDEFANPFQNNASCSTVGINGLYRADGLHSCTDDATNGDPGDAVCFGMPDIPNFVDDHSYAVKFDINIDPTSGFSGITKLEFLEYAPEEYLWSAENIPPNTGVNNYPTKYGLRVLKDGAEIYKQIDIATEQIWNLESFDFSSNPAFKSDVSATYTFELLAYAPVGNGVPAFAWDVDDIKVFAGCCSTTTTEEVTYLWSNNQTDSTIVVSEAGTYSVTITDCSGATSTDEVVVNITDADNDGVCDNEDCQPDDPFYPATPGVTCDDNNPNTMMDIVLADSCSCEGIPTPQLYITDATVNEEDGTATVNICIGQASTVDVSTGYFTVDGTAVFSDDYEAVASSATIFAGETCVQRSIVIIDDATPEDTEAFTIELTNPTNAVIDDGTSTITILDIDYIIPNVSVNDVTVNEEDGEATLQICVDQLTTVDVSVDYSTQDGLATAPDDYLTTNNTVTVTAGTYCVEVTVPIVDDATPEETEAFTVVLSNPVNGLIPNNSGNVYILDTDVIIPGLSINDVTVNEEDGFATLNICIDEVTSVDVSTSYFTTDGTALAGSDYQNTVGSTTIFAGETCVQIQVPILNDSEYEETENFIITLNNPVNATLTDEIGEVTILDTDPDCSLLQLSATTSDLLCSGNETGSIELTVNGGTGNYTYNWSNGATEQNISNLAEGDYTVIVVDANGCSTSDTYSINSPATLIIEASMTSIINCFGDENGSIELIVTGGTEPYAFNWSNGSIEQNPSGLVAGDYTVIITDANNCSLTETYTIQGPAALAQDANTTNITCFGDEDGSISVTVTGGVEPYTFNWSNGSTEQNPNGLAAGDYTVIVSDSNGCSSTDTYTIDGPAALTQEASTINTTCFGDEDGSITVTVTGGTEPYTFDWSNGSTEQNPTGLAAGDHTVIITDANGCSSSDTYTVEGPAAIIQQASAVNVNCFGDEDGSIEVVVTGGTQPYTFNWSNGSTEQNPTGLAAGDYTVIITDANNCSLTETYIIEGPAVLTQDANATSVTCFGDEDGSIILTVTGGTEPYTFNWSNGSTEQNPNGLAAGDYTVIVSDANGCSSSDNYTIDGPAALTQEASMTNVTCFGDEDGSITVTVTGGSQPYTFNWSNGSTDQNPNGLAAGDYTVIISDANGCLSYGTYIVDGPAALIQQASTTNVNCFGDENGSIEVIVTGGTEPYTFDWSNGSTEQNQSGLAAGDYTVIISDANGCFSSDNYTIDGSSEISIEANVTDVNCFGNSNGSIEMLVAGGTDPYTYNWSNGATTKNINNLTGGTYIVTVTDNNLCELVQSFIVEEASEALSIVGIKTDPTCDGSTDGNVDLTILGGTSPYSFAWSNAATTEDLTAIGAGTYTATVTDANGCNDIISLTLNDPNLNTFFDAPKTICQAINFDLEANNEGAGSTYNWYFWNGPTTNSTFLGVMTGMSINYTFQSAGDKLVRLVVITGAGCDIEYDEVLTVLASNHPDCSNCDNVTYGGYIGKNQVGCSPLVTNVIVNNEEPTGGSGDIEFMWMQSYVGGVPTSVNDPNWTIIPGETTKSYDPGTIDITTFFIRLSKRVECEDWMAGLSNIIEKTVLGEGITASYTSDEFVCPYIPAIFTADDVNTTATYVWFFFDGPSATDPFLGSDEGLEIEFSFTTSGQKLVRLYVETDYGCSDTYETVITVLSPYDPMCAANIIPETITLNAKINGNSEVELDWTAINEGLDVFYDVQRSVDGINYQIVNTINGLDGEESNYDYVDDKPEIGTNYYRIKKNTPQGGFVFSNVQEVINKPTSDPRTVSTSPNPVEGPATLILSDPFEQKANIEVTNAFGKTIMSIDVPAGVYQVQIDLSKYDAGFYFVYTNENGYRQLVDKILKLTK